MKMMWRLLYVPIALVVMNAGHPAMGTPKTTARTTTTTKPTTTRTTTWPSTTVPQSNLNGKMVTLSFNGGGISFYPPNFYPSSSSTPVYTTRPYTTTTYPPWTTAPPTGGVTVCVRYLTDFQQTNSPSIFTLSPSSRTAMTLTPMVTGSYRLSWERLTYYIQYLKPEIRFWSNIGPDIWTRVCLTVDNMKNVAQVFSGTNMSIRKVLPIQYVWSGEPVIDFSGFDGQVTDVQMWDYPLSYREIFNYMTNLRTRPYSGSVLTWSNINYSLRGKTLLEDRYEWQDQQPISRRGRGRRPKGERKTRKVFNESGRKERKRL